MPSASPSTEVINSFEFMLHLIDNCNSAFAIQCTRRALLIFQEKYVQVKGFKIYEEQLTNKLIDKIPKIIKVLKIDDILYTGQTPLKS